MSLDAYEQREQLLDFSQKAPTRPSGMVSALTKSQASVITELTNAYTKAARDLLK